MTNITKKVDRGIHPVKRTQNFTDSDAVQGDVLMISSSLGHSASSLTIESDSILRFRLNVYHIVYPKRKLGDGFPNTYGQNNVALGQTYQSAEGAVITVEANTVYSIENELPIDDIELVTVSGAVFDIFVS